MQTSRIENVVQAIVNGVQLDNLNATIEELKARREQLRESIDTIPAASPKLTYDHFRMALALIIEKAQTEDFKALLSAVVNCIVVDDQNVVICINLTDESNTPPMEQIRFSVKNESLHLTLNKIQSAQGWLLIAA